MFADEHMCGQIKFQEGRKAYALDCGRKNVSEVSVRMSSGWIQVCELEVFGKFVRSTTFQLLFYHCLLTSLSTSNESNNLDSLHVSKFGLSPKNHTVKTLSMRLKFS